MTEAEQPDSEPECEHKNRKFLRTIEDWFDGDEDDVYECLDCGKEFKVYVPR